MTKLILLPITLAVLLASCNSTQNVIIDPVDPVIPPVVTAYTSLDATVDLTKGTNGGLFRNIGSPTYYLIKFPPTSGGSAVLAQTTLATDGHVRLTLPDAAALAPFLDQVTPTQATVVEPTCNVKSFNVSPTTFKAVTAGHVLKVGDASDPSLNYSGYLSMASVSSDGNDGRNLIYVDQDVDFNFDADCFNNGREDRRITKMNLRKGWNVVSDNTVETGTTSAPIYTHITQNEQVTTATATLLLWTSSQTSAPLTK